MDETKRKFRGLLYFGIGIISLIYAISYLSEGLSYSNPIPYGYLVFLIPSFVLTGITFFFGIMAFRLFSQFKKS